MSSPGRGDMFQEREFNLLVLLEHEQNCGYVARKLYAQASSQEELVQAIRHAFSIERPIQISYFDTEYQSYVVPIDFTEIPSKGKVKVRDARGRRPTEEDLQSLLDLNFTEKDINAQEALLKKKTPLDSFLSSEELYQMLWTLLIVIANNLPSAPNLSKERHSTFSHSKNEGTTKSQRARTTGQIHDAIRIGQQAIAQFVSMVHTMANIFPDPNTRIVLHSVLQDYDLKEQSNNIKNVHEAREWTRCVFSRVNEALQNTFDGDFNQHTLTAQDEIAEIQATWFPITETNLTEYKLEVNTNVSKNEEKYKFPREFAEVLNKKEKKTQFSAPKSKTTSLLRRNSFLAKAKGEAHSPFAAVPDELLMYIFDFLDPYELHWVYTVCKRWSVIAAEPFLWKRLFKLNWKLRSDWMGNWDVFIMYSSDNWMRAFDQWYYWELANSLLNAADSEDNIIYETNDEEIRILVNLLDPERNVVAEPSPEPSDGIVIPRNSFSLQSPLSPIPTPITKSDPIRINSELIPEIKERARPKSMKEVRARTVNNPPTISTTPICTTWKVGRKRTNTSRASLLSPHEINVSTKEETKREETKEETPNLTPIGTPLLFEEGEEDLEVKEEIEVETKEAQETSHNVKVHRLRSGFQMEMGLIERSIFPNREPSAVLPDIAILLPPCLAPLSAQFIRFTVPEPTFQPPPSNEIIQRATLMKLLQHLTSPYTHDLQYMKTFMLTYVYFTAPQTLLKLLVRRYYIRTSDETQEWEESIKKPVQLRVFNILKFWLENYEMDFESHLMTSMKEFAQKALPPIMSKQILRVIVQKRGGVEKSRTVTDFQFNSAPPYPDVPKNIFSQTLQIWDVSDLEIARQLTIIEYNMFAAIRPRELLNQAWKHPKRKKISPNILKMLARFQDLSSKWVPQMIERAPLLKQKVKTLKRFITICFELVKVRNFHDATAIFQGIKTQCEIRFPRIWADLPNKFKKDYAMLESIFTSDEEYKKRLEGRDPCIPLLDYHLKRLVAVEAFVPSSIGHMVNFTKCRYIYKVVSEELIRFQQTPYNLQPVTQIADLLQNFDDDLEGAALGDEPIQ